ncbi:NmrA family NAD(P)-binding protein [Salinispira pacifica]|uniref:NmrA-like domain-containing protein n=1 Tax=Salinispira pacifica TaxID=1307761 RepID=V5WEU5_9SPIO|nr:NmrA family NAD(P)-binding protein [Salinispira pacifica]AHC14054.1 hypothetical protein, putative YesF [Salinispira pacifica]
MTETYFVTGATGNVGREVVKHLLANGKRVIGAKLPRENTVDAENLEYRVFDFSDESTWEHCMEGVTKVFLMRPPHISKIKRDMYPFMRFLAEKQIEQVVFLSVQGVEGNKMVPHYDVEQGCIEMNLPYTFVRPSFFMQNLTTTHLPEIRDEKRLMVPAGKGRTNFIDVRDIGEVMAKMFFDPSNIRKAYTITGQTSFSYQEIADHLTNGLGTPIRYAKPGMIRFVAYHLKRGRKLAMTLVMLALYTIVRLGKGDISTDTAEKILGRKPRTLDEFIADNRALLLGEAS